MDQVQSFSQCFETKEIPDAIRRSPSPFDTLLARVTRGKTPDDFKYLQGLNGFCLFSAVILRAFWLVFGVQAKDRP